MERAGSLLFGLAIAAISASPSAHAEDMRRYDQTPVASAELAAVEPEILNAARLAYASAYWKQALRLTRTDGALRNQFWSLADETLAELPQDAPDVAEVRRVLEYEKDHPGGGMGWFDKDRHDDWVMRIGYMLPVDALNNQFYGKDRRTCRIVLAIALDRAVQELRAFEDDTSPENFWALSIAVNAGAEAFNGCPEPGSSENPLLMDFAQAFSDARQTVWLHTQDYWPPLEPSEDSWLLPENGAVIKVEQKLVTACEMQAVSDDLSERALRVWRSGPDNSVLRLWNRMQRIKEEWPD